MDWSPTLVEALLKATRDGGVLRFDQDSTTRALRATVDRGRFSVRINVSLAELHAARVPELLLANELDHLDGSLQNEIARSKEPS